MWSSANGQFLCHPPPKRRLRLLPLLPPILSSLCPYSYSGCPCSALVFFVVSAVCSTPRTRTLSCTSAEGMHAHTVDDPRSAQLSTCTHARTHARIYAAGVRETLADFLDGKPIRDDYLIAQGGKLAGVGAHSYSEGNATGGSEEAVKYVRHACMHATATANPRIRTHTCACCHFHANTCSYLHRYSHAYQFKCSCPCMSNPTPILFAITINHVRHHCHPVQQ